MMPNTTGLRQHLLCQHSLPSHLHPSRLVQGAGGAPRYPPSPAPSRPAPRRLAPPGPGSLPAHLSPTSASARLTRPHLLPVAGGHWLGRTLAAAPADTPRGIQALPASETAFAFQLQRRVRRLPPFAGTAAPRSPPPACVRVFAHA